MGRYKKKTSLTPALLRTIARAMLPFYKAVATRERYASEWSKAVIKADLDRMQALLRITSPIAAKQGLSCNAIGYFISFSPAKSYFEYTCGTSIPPGIVQFTFETQVHRAIARSLMPLYHQIATSRCFRQAFTKAIRLHAEPIIIRMIRSLVTTPALKSITLEHSGITLSFRFKASKYTYRHQLFQDMG